LWLVVLAEPVTAHANFGNFDAGAAQRAIVQRILLVLADFNGGEQI